MTRQQKAQIICLNEQVAGALRQGDLQVISDIRDQYIFDLSPAVYLHAPSVVALKSVPEVKGESDPAWGDLWMLFIKGCRASDVFLETAQEPARRIPKFSESVAAGAVLPVVFAEKTAVDDREALLPWMLWREAGQAEHARQEGRPISERDRHLIRWRQSWSPPHEMLSLEPSFEYNSAILRDLLPSRQYAFDVWPDSPPLKHPPVDKLRAMRLYSEEESASADLDDLPRLFGCEHVGVTFAPAFQFLPRNCRMRVHITPGSPKWARSLAASFISTPVVLCKVDASSGEVGIPDIYDKTFWAADENRPVSLEESIAIDYGVIRTQVQILPLFANGIGETLGLAVRIGRGAILVLPETPHKAAVVKRLATDLCEPLQEWLRSVSQKPPLSEATVLPGAQSAEPENTPGERASETRGTPAQGGNQEKWRDVQRRLLALRRSGVPYTSYRDLAARMGCAKPTLKKAFDDSQELKAWRDGNRTASPRAQSLGEVVTDSVCQAKEADPADMLSDKDVDSAMARLIEEADREERARLNALNPEDQRKAAQLYYEQRHDDPDVGRQDGRADVLRGRKA